MDENKLKHLSSWDGNAFINRYGSYAPWYDDKADYNTNAQSYYDYLAKINQFLEDVTIQINRLLKRDIDVIDTKSIDLSKIGSWLTNNDTQKYDDLVKIAADVIISKKFENRILQHGSHKDFLIPNGLKEKDDGLWSPDYYEMFTDLDNALGTIKLSNSYGTLRRLGQKYRNPNKVASSAQGFASLGNNICVQYFQNAGLVDDKTKGILLKFDIETGKEILSNEIIGFHGNSMTYNQYEKMLYLTESYGKGSSRLLKIDPNDLTIKDYIDLKDSMAVEQVHSVGYDDVDKIYVVSDNHIMDFYSEDWTKLFTLKWEDIVDFTPDWMQGVQINGTTLYWLGGRKSQIWAYTIDLKTQSLKFNTCYNFDDFQENLYPTGELEGLGFDYRNNKIYVCSHVDVSNFRGLTQYFVTNQEFKAPSSGSRTINTQPSNVGPKKIYAGKNNNYNPDGTKSNPFASLLEACVCMRSPQIPYPQLNLKDDFLDETLVLTNINNGMFSCLGHKVKAAVITNVSNFYIAQLRTTGRSHWNDNALYIYNSDLRVNIYFSENLANDEKLKDIIYIERSNVFLQTDKPTYQIQLTNTILTSDIPFENIVKSNNASLFYGKKPMGKGTITDIQKISDLDDEQFLMYKNMYARIDVVDNNDNNFGFLIDRRINIDTFNLTGFSRSNDTFYILDFHYVKDDPNYTTLNVTNLSSGKKLDLKSYKINIMIGD